MEFKSRLRSNRARFWTALALTAGLAAMGAWKAYQEAQAFRGFAEHELLCTGIVDGDTLRVQRAGGLREKVRVLGIDCLETRNLEKQERQAAALNKSSRAVLRLGEQATRYAKTHLLNQRISLVQPGEQEARDDYGRLLCYVEVKGADYGAGILEVGLAEARRERHPRRRLYHELAKRARRDGVGIYAP